MGTDTNNLSSKYSAALEPEIEKKVRPADDGSADYNQEKHYWKGMIPCKSGICQSNVLLWTKMTTLSEAWQKVMRTESIRVGAVAAAVRKVEHELGVVDLRPDECRVMGRFLYKAVMKDSLWGEHELDYVVITRGLSLSRLTPNPSEVSDVRLVDEKELSEWVTEEPSSFSPWFLLFYRLRHLSEWWSKLDRIESYPVDMNIVRMN
ncbi:putative isopentenyl-diphosphate delta-isomerase [Teladorsagia circumcincta]|uniref:Putative isopentenyl-diphosphate delta-isomerase n=1 Tax=Teladorsagia circumcincta TaxID=45464 RepID=A0A2G9V4P3_TELCI|nr:putative isopentenyl-diphosphate delta-isomerase [Teladorsagia circumcincta]